MTILDSFLFSIFFIFICLRFLKQKTIFDENLKSVAYIFMEFQVKI